MDVSQTMMVGARWTDRVHISATYAYREDMVGQTVGGHTRPGALQLLQEKGEKRGRILKARENSKVMASVRANEKHQMIYQMI